MSAKKIRDLERLLRKKREHAESQKLSEEVGDVPPPVEDTSGLVEKLTILKKQKQQNAIKIKEKKLAVKYHMVKFVERKKVTRKISSLDSKIRETKSNSPGAAGLLKKLEEERALLEEDLTYIMYYPKNLKYIALFPDSEAEALASGGAPQADDADTDTAAADAEAGGTAQRIKATAKSRALKERKEAASAGKEDRVTHAILVATKKGPSKVNAKSNTAMQVEDATVSLKRPLQHIVRAGLVATSSKPGGAKANSKEVSRAPNDDEVDSDDTSDSSDDIDTDSNSDDEDIEIEDDDVEIKGLVNKKLKLESGESREKSQKQKGDKPSKEKSDSKSIFKPDSFFAEEAAVAMEEEEDQTPAEAAMSRNRAANGNVSNRNYSRPPPKTKQEARLQKWQGERREKQQQYLGRIPIPGPARPSVGGGGGGGGVGGGGGTSRHEQRPRSDRGARPDRSRTDNTTTHGVHKNSLEHQQQRPRPYSAQAAAPSSLPADRAKRPWEVSGAGGVSAAAVTAATVNKLNGTIVKSTNKKITFD